MNKSLFIVALFSMLLIASCGNNTGKKKQAKEETTKSVTVEEQYITEDLRIKLDSLVSELGHLGAIPIFSKAADGTFSLSDKEKKVKPNYLLPLSKANTVISLNQKYRAVMMYRIDMAVAGMYDMPVGDYKQTIAKLVVEINDPAFKVDINQNLKTDPDAFKKFITDVYDAEKENGTINFFWDAAVAGIIEQLYVATKNIDKFILCFDDETASEVTYRFILVHDGIESLVPYHPELEHLQVILEPLRVINAINVKQLRAQLEDLKDEISVAREKLLE